MYSATIKPVVGIKGISQAMTHQLIRLRTLTPFEFILMTIGFAIFGFGQQAISQPTRPGTQVHVTLKDFSVHPNHTTTKAGWVTFQAVNAGTMAHELVILRTDLHPADLPRIAEKDKKGTVTGHIVNEEHTAVEPIEEIEEFPAGTRKEKKVLLDPGRYVLFCNVPKHYDKGMYASFIVEK
jgi:uncharacterized cupredoxin-like copper-binding protein